MLSEWNFEFNFRQVLAAHGLYDSHMLISLSSCYAAPKDI